MPAEDTVIPNMTKKGRIIEVGESNTLTYAEPIGGSHPMYPFAAMNSQDFPQPQYGNNDVVQTRYSKQLPGVLELQENLRNRVSSIAFYANSGNSSFNNATHYSYDEHGNVKKVVQQTEDIGNRKTEYEYSLLSSLVNKVSYQAGANDQFFHKYNYDYDNRLAYVNTSKDNLTWDKDASYKYYAHGPLARTVIGDLQVQGLDYAYTIQGWLKGVNSSTLALTRDMGRDGMFATMNTINSPVATEYTARDVFGYTLGYYGGDYKAIVPKISKDRFEADLSGSALKADAPDLFNGNIASIVTALVEPGGQQMPVQGTAYKYDQLNRLTRMTAFQDVGSNSVDYIVAGNKWGSGSTLAIDDYKTEISYYGNGNIHTLARKTKFQAGSNEMDNLEYKYSSGEWQNRLDHIIEGNDHPTLNFGDLKGQAAGNYGYDEIGNMTSDTKNHITEIKWNVYGKVTEVIKDKNFHLEDLEFKYDALGNRTASIVKPHKAASVGLTNENEWIKTYYIHDAQGNVMGIYDFTKPVAHSLYPAFSVSYIRLKEHPIYGSSRLGSAKYSNKNITSLLFTDALSYTANGQYQYKPYATELALNSVTSRTLGEKQYELSNHLGNVMTTISDRKPQQQTASEVQSIISGFDGSDAYRFDRGNYVTALDNQAPVLEDSKVKLSYPSGKIYGPTAVIKVKPGDVITASVYGYSAITNGGSGIFIMDIGDGVGEHANSTQHPGQDVEYYAAYLQGNSTWNKLEFGPYTVPGGLNFNGIPAKDVYVTIYPVVGAGAGDVSFDNLDISVTHNTPEVFYTADVTSATDYYAFGMKMPGREFNKMTAEDNGTGIRYGYNGKEQLFSANNVDGATYDYGARMYDARLGRWMSVDPAARAYAFASPYNAFGNNPILNTDGDGRFTISTMLTPGVHERITQNALCIATSTGICRLTSGSILVSGVRHADIESLKEEKFNPLNGVDYHFDNLSSFGDAIERWNVVQERINGANQLLDLGWQNEGEFGYGIIAHSVEDFYSHSTYVEIAMRNGYLNYTEIPLFDEVVNNEECFDINFVNDLKANLKSGTYGGHVSDLLDNKYKEGSHGKINKDLGLDATFDPNQPQKQIQSFAAEHLATKAAAKLFSGGSFTKTTKYRSPVMKKEVTPKMSRNVRFL